MKKLLTAVSVLLVSGMMFTSAQTNPNCVILTNDMGVGATDATTGGDVTKLQNLLITRGFLQVKSGTALGTYGSQTSRAVAQFQKGYGIIATGYVGPITRSNIQTLTCAIGSVNTSALPTTTISTSSVSLLTFTSPMPGALVVKGEKDITPDWTVATDVKTLFAGSPASIQIELLDSTGAVVGILGNSVKINTKNNNKIENSFVRTLKGRGGREDNSVDPGQYRLRATLVYGGASTTLATQASRYASESGWFSIVNPAPTSIIKISASTTTIPVSAPVVISWTATPGSTGCTFTNVASSTTVNVGATGTTTVTPSVTSTYRVACNLTSEWPFSGMTYTTETKKNITITVGTVVSSVCSSAQTLIGGVCVANPSVVATTYRNFVASTQSTCNTLVTSAYGSLVKSCTIGGGCSLTGGLPTSTSPSANLTLWGACVSSTATASTTPTSPTITLKTPLSGSTITIGNPIPFSWSYSGAGQNQHVNYTVALVSSEPGFGGVGGGSGGQQVSANVGSGSGSYQWQTGSGGFLEVPGVYDVFVTLNECNPSGCNYAPSGAVVARSVKNRITIVSPQSATTYRNFVASTQSICNTSVTNVYGSLVKSCTIGGGCTLNGQVPTSTNLSANPTLWGACVSSNTTSNTTSTQATACTQDAKRCSDGSYVGRTGANCEFAACPVSPSDTSTVSTAPVEPTFSATCTQERGKYKVAIKWNKVNDAKSYPVRLTNPSGQTTVIGVPPSNSWEGSSVPSAPTGTSYTFTNQANEGTYTYWGHAWNSNGWSGYTKKTVTCSSSSAYEPGEEGALAASLAISSSAVLGVSTSATCTNLSYNFHRGNESQSVTNLQNFLIANGYLNDSATGFFGDKTVAAVKAYQESRGLPMTGMVYGFTRESIRADSCQ